MISIETQEKISKFVKQYTSGSKAYRQSKDFIQVIVKDKFLKNVDGKFVFNFTKGGEIVEAKFHHIAFDGKKEVQNLFV